jgi:drug/metabolite transporter (DMT)-like permease
MPPLSMVGARYVVAGGLLYPVARRTAARGAARSRVPGAGAFPRPTRPGLWAWLAGAVVGLLLLAAGNGGLTVGETTLPSGLAAVLVATVPVVAVLAGIVPPGERLTWHEGLGAALVVGSILITLHRSSRAAEPAEDGAAAGGAARRSWRPKRRTP